MDFGGENDFFTTKFSSIVIGFYCSRDAIVLSRGKTLFNPLTPGAFYKKCVFLDSLVAFRLDLGQISFNPVENAFAIQQLAFH